uniref:Uncharacterized protein n=1 Tax=Amorphochlora amoebiformis TaxID=1561963 RepID=A0A7S0CQN8_9EUKA|mmetsp:Transcript_1068/g.1487  ORF Transcript_1068/g.1487 Transcript_1068/m.1487 type:complete len:250 (+) Transcript_1068:20-769(+)
MALLRIGGGVNVRLLGHRAGASLFSTSNGAKTDFVPNLDRPAYVIDRWRFEKEMTETRLRFKRELKEKEDERARIAAEKKALKDARDAERRRIKAEERAKFLVEKKRIEELRFVQRQKDLAEQIRKWRYDRHDKLDEMREELQCLLVKESPEWISDPEQITEEIFDNQVILEGFWPEKHPVHVKVSKKPYEYAVRFEGLHERLTPQSENEIEAKLRVEKERNDKAHILLVEGEEGFENSQPPPSETADS